MSPMSAVVREVLLQKDQAVGVAEKYGNIEGEQHKQWVIDQMLRCLLSESYDQWRIEQEEETGEPWDTGVAP